MLERTGLFIDGGYLVSALRREFGLMEEFPINPLKMCADLIKRVDAGRLQRAYYYDCPPYQHETPRKGDDERATRKKKLFDFINDLPNFEVRLGELKLVVLRDGKEEYVQKGVDLLMGIDLVRMASKGAMSDAIILTGDADFVPAVEAAKAEGVNVTCVTGKMAAKSLITICDHHILMTKAILKLWLPSE